LRRRKFLVQSAADPAPAEKSRRNPPPSPVPAGKPLCPPKTSGAIRRWSCACRKTLAPPETPGAIRRRPCACQKSPASSAAAPAGKPRCCLPPSPPPAKTPLPARKPLCPPKTPGAIRRRPCTCRESPVPAGKPLYRQKLPAQSVASPASTGNPQRHPLEIPGTRWKIAVPSPTDWKVSALPAIPRRLEIPGTCWKLPAQSPAGPCACRKSPAPAENSQRNLPPTLNPQHSSENPCAAGNYWCNPPPAQRPPKNRGAIHRHPLRLLEIPGARQKTLEPPETPSAISRRPSAPAGNPWRPP